jgi:hypothetical protein
MGRQRHKSKRPCPICEHLGTGLYFGYIVGNNLGVGKNVRSAQNRKAVYIMHRAHLIKISYDFRMSGHEPDTRTRQANCFGETANH